MFALKLTLALVIILFLTYNGMAIFATEKPPLQKWIEFTLYTIILMVLANIVISVATYYSTKYKIGSVGDKGIRGQSGKDGEKGKCEENCGTKVCQIDLTNVANEAFYLELEKIYGGVMLKYNLGETKVDTNTLVNQIWNKIYENHRISLIKAENRDKFRELDNKEKRKTIEDLLKIYATTSPDLKRVYVRIHGGQELGDDLRARISSNREYFKYKNLVPQLVSKEDNLDLINLCLTETINKEMVVLEDDNRQNENEEKPPVLTIKNCNSNDGDNEDEKEGNDEKEGTEGIARVENGDSEAIILNKDLIKLKIRNEYFKNKIRSICNSPEYQEILETNVDNRPNEKRLIEFISKTVSGWVSTLMNFSYFKPETDEISYGGMRFLLTREADINVFDEYLGSESYKASFTKKELVELNPINELRKYDIWNWNQPYTNVPLLFEKCDKAQEQPQGLEPILSIVKTNNYEKVYDSKVKKSKWYSTDKYCPFNQMGEFNDNPNNVRECVFYDTNNQGHDYLEGKQPAWKSIEYSKPKSIGFYHPKSKPKEEIDEPTPGERNEAKNEYHKDEQGRYYYPIGSVWSGLIVDDTDGRKDANEFTPESRETNTGNLGNGPEKETVLVSGDVVDPIDYIKIWNSKGDGDGCLDCQEEEATIWRPIAPEGYMCLGDVVVKGNAKPDPRDVSLVKCVPEKCVAKVPLGQKVWDADKLAKKVFAEDETTGESAIHPIHKFYIKLSQNFDNIDYSDNSTFRIMSSDLIQIIDELINEEERKKEIIRKNSNIYKNPFSNDINIKRLNAFKRSEFIRDYPIKSYSELQKYKRSKKNLYLLGNKINGVVSKILELYSQKYQLLKDVSSTEFTEANLELNRINTTISIPGQPQKKLNFKDNETTAIKPIITGSKKVNIYSAGASKNNMERGYRMDLNIKPDGGHNLFLADNGGTFKKPEFAYKLKKQCFQSVAGKPIETNTVAGTLSNLERNDEARKSAESYFTFPMNILITSENGNKRSPTGNPKKYYLTLAKTIEDKTTRTKTPVYIIRTADKKTKEFSNCIGVYGGRLVSAAINTSYKGNYWIIENIDDSKSPFVGGNDVQGPVIVNIKSYNDRNKLFSHEYNLYGKGVETLKSSSSSTDTTCKWKSEKLRD